MSALISGIREAHFWSKVRIGSGCWEWSGSRSGSGYGNLRLHRQADNEYAHRASWRLVFGPIPAGLCVLHSCDNRICVRPSHLFLGTIADNNADMMRKGRHVPRRKLKPDQLLAVRSLLRQGHSGSSIARKFGVAASCISGIKRGELYVDRAR